MSHKRERELTDNEETSRETSNIKKHSKSAKLASEMKKPQAPEAGGPPKRSGEEFHVSVVVEVQGEVIYVKGKTKHGDKFETPKPITLGQGPLTHKVTATWPDFLNFVTHLTKTIPKYLVTRSMTWRWLSNKNSTLPLTDNEGLATMINEIKARKPGSAGIVVIGMSMPLSPKLDTPQVSWALDGDHNGAEVLDTSNKENNEPFGRYDKKVLLDKQLEPIVKQLEMKYTIGTCTLHPDIQCFRHGPTDMHFNLKPHVLKAWANHILQDRTNTDCLPFGYKFFQPTDTIKSPSKSTPNVTIGQMPMMPPGTVPQPPSQYGGGPGLYAAYPTPPYTLYQHYTVPPPTLYSSPWGAPFPQPAYYPSMLPLMYYSVPQRFHPSFESDHFYQHHSFGNRSSTVQRNYQPQPQYPPPSGPPPAHTRPQAAPSSVQSSQQHAPTTDIFEADRI
ncbi:hypothetical protein PAXINDRAFT_153425 [Paxillus involutus ATCC 200175]|nr:hypothetical protein PAXINDRAFT_153425 [Paxillus involutus ATCC 200175]